MKKTPLLEKLQEYVQGKPARFHMPGHKGTAAGALWELFGEHVWRYDVTEVPGLDSLYEASACLSEVEQALCACYGAGASLLSAGGSTLCIQTMLAVYCPAGSQVLMGRNLHKSAVSACGLLDLHPIWMEQESRGAFPVPITPEQVEQALSEHPQASAVYITSPDYWGQTVDIDKIGEICHRRNVPLLVDNAHGAHFSLLEEEGFFHPMKLGADACADSLHKSLPALTGAAALHLRHRERYGEAKLKMGWFGSTSPSYLIMASVDSAVDWSVHQGKTCAKSVGEMVKHLRREALERGFRIPHFPHDPWKVTLDYRGTDCSKENMAQRLNRQGMVPEYVDEGILLLMCSAQNRQQDFLSAFSFLEDFPKKESALSEKTTRISLPEKKCSVRQALFSAGEAVPVKAALGRVSAALYAPCPPGIPVVVPGELVTESAVDKLEKSGFQQIFVCREAHI